MGKERMLITGGHALEGEVRVSGGKNTAVAVIPATLLSDEPCTIENLPDIEDVHALADILTELGAKVDYEPGRCMRVDPRPADGTEVSYHNAQRLRASYYLLGALLGRSAIPECFIDSLELRDVIEEIATDLYTGCIISEYNPFDTPEKQRWNMKYCAHKWTPERPSDEKSH